MARKTPTDKPLVLKCCDCGSKATRVRIDYVGGALYVTSNFHSPDIEVALNDAGLVEVKCARHGKLGEFQPYQQQPAENQPTEDIVGPSVESFVMAIHCAYDFSLSYEARSLALLLNLTSATALDLKRKLSWQWLAETLHLPDVKHLGPLIQELQAAGWLDDKMRFRDVSPWGQDDVMPAQSSTTIH